MCRTEKHWLLCKHRAFCVWDLERPPGKDARSWTSQRHLLLLLLLPLLQPVLASLQSFVRSTRVLSNVRDLNYFCSHVCAFWKKNMSQLPLKSALQQIQVKWRKSRGFLSKLWNSHLSNKILVICIRYFPVYILCPPVSFIDRENRRYCLLSTLPTPLGSLRHQFFFRYKRCKDFCINWHVTGSLRSLRGPSFSLKSGSRNINLTVQKLLITEAPSMVLLQLPEASSTLISNMISTAGAWSWHVSWQFS